MFSDGGTGIILASDPVMPSVRSGSSTLILFAAWLCVACGGDEGDPMAKSRATWAAERPTSYVIEECVSGLGSWCTQTAVTDERVMRAREVSPESRELDVSELSEPIEARFDEIDTLHEDSDCHGVRQSFDPSYGYPNFYEAYCRTEPFENRVRCFLADTNDLDACPSAE